MNYKMMGRFLSWILLIEAVFMLPALGISLADGTRHVTISFLITLGLMLAVAGLLMLFSRRSALGFFAKEGLVCVGASWIMMSVFGCLPFCLSGEIPHFVDALFEMVSGFTTTGSSVVSDVEALSRGILYWRSFSHWLGGMGVLVFLLAIVPVSGSRGFTVHLLRAESPGPDVGKLVPKMRQTAAVLYVTYLVLTLFNIVFLLVGDMPLFEALCTAFGTAGTGGFGIKNNSMAGYSPYLQNVTTVFMLLFGINFSCFYLLILRKFYDVFRDEELRFYLCTVLAAVALITFNIRGMYTTLAETVRHAAFQVSTIITTTGYATTDFDLWPSFSKAVLLILMFIGACAGSTGGGFKCSRLLLIIKDARRNLAQMLHPQKVQVIRINGKPIGERVVSNATVYLGVYVLILLVSFLAVSLDGHSVTTNFSAVMSCLNNIGPGLDAVGPIRNFSVYSIPSKLVLIFDMLAGRLELFPILVLFSARTWKRA